MASAGTEDRKAPPSRHLSPQARPRWLIPLVAAMLLAVGVAVAVLTRTDSSPAPTAALPDTPDYHSLLVAPDDPNALTLGTHEGLFRSSDGGETWTKAELDGQDAMSLARPSPRTLWAAGHDVLARSLDGGASWQDVRPSGLPGLDVHGLAVDPNDPDRLYAAIAGQGLYRSNDAGASFALVSTAVGPGVMALAVMPDGRLLAGDMQRRALAASDDGGENWRAVIEASVAGLAVNPSRAELVLASGPGVLRSTDGARTWKRTLALEAGSGPIAWSTSDPGIAYVVGFDRSLWRSVDAGATWAAVVSGATG